MTTQIDVKANHGWPVKVTGVNPKTGEDAGYGGTVPAGETRTFHCHSTMDLVVHEIQPNEDQPSAAYPPHGSGTSAVGTGFIAIH